MSLDTQQPLNDSQSFNEANSTYVTYPSQADAMIANLQLSHNVPCHIMDLVLSVITRPDFDAKQVKLRESINVVEIAEESRLKDRLAVVHQRSLGEDGRIEQVGFPEFVLHEVLDILHAERLAAIWSSFDRGLDKELVYKSGYIYEDRVLKEMSLVHRSWTIPSQKALGRILFVNRPAKEIYLPVQRSNFGPWTTVAALHLYCGMDDEAEYDEYHFSYNLREEYLQWFETLHRILVGFTNLRSIWVQSFALFFTKQANLTIRELLRRNTHLEDVKLYVEDEDEPFILDIVAEDSKNLQHLKTLDIRGARFSDASRGKPLQRTGLLRLRSLTIIRAFSSLENDLETLRILSTLSRPCLESLHIFCRYYLPDPELEQITARVFPPTQCAASFNQLRSLRIDGENDTTFQWLKWIVPYSSNLENVTLNTDMLFTVNALSLIPMTLRSLNLRVTNVRWMETEAITGWMKCILKLFSSSRFPELKAFSLLAERRFYYWEYVYDVSREQEAQNMRNQIQEFEESLRCLCKSAGTDCTLDL